MRSHLVESGHAGHDSRLYLAAPSRGSRVLDYVFGLVYVLLLVRLALEFFGARSQAGFVTFIRSLTDTLYAPFKGIFATTNIQGEHRVAARRRRAGVHAPAQRPARPAPAAGTRVTPQPLIVATVRAAAEVPAWSTHHRPLLEGTETMSTEHIDSKIDRAAEAAKAVVADAKTKKETVKEGVSKVVHAAQETAQKAVHGAEELAKKAQHKGHDIAAAVADKLKGG